MEEIQSERVKRDTLISEIKGDTEYLLASTVHEEEERIKTENIIIAIDGGNMFGITFRKSILIKNIPKQFFLFFLFLQSLIIN